MINEAKGETTSLTPSIQIEYSSVKIEVWPTKSNNNYGSGSLVLWHDKIYLITNKHVAKEGTADFCFRKLTLHTTWFGSFIIDISRAHIIEFEHPDIDMILISIDDDIVPDKSRILKISEEELRIHQKLSGLSYREHGKVGVQGFVLEKSNKNCEFITNHNGARGFSGTGLFLNGKVCGVYAGWDRFKHLHDEISNTELDELDTDDFESLLYWQKEIERICNKGLGESCIKRIDGYVTTLSRNPRSRVFDASCFFTEAKKVITNINICMYQ